MANQMVFFASLMVLEIDEVRTPKVNNGCNAVLHMYYKRQLHFKPVASLSFKLYCARLKRHVAF